MAHLDMKRITHAALFTPLSGGRWGAPLIFWGQPGVAKTALIEEVAREAGLPCQVLSPGEHGEGAFGVVPVPQDGVLCYPPPEWTERLDTERGGLVFVDELTTAPPALQAPLLGLIHARRIGGTVLNGHVRVLGAANPVAQAAGGYDLAPALSNRLGHIDWVAPTADEWADWLVSDAGRGPNPSAPKPSPTAEEARVLELWPAAFAKAAGQMAAFVRRRSELHNKMPNEGDPQASRAWASSRSEELAARMLAAGVVHGLSEVETDALMSGFVGAAFVTEFATFRSAVDLPDPGDLLDGKVKFEHKPTRLDRTAAVLDSCTALVLNEKCPNRAPRVEALWEVMGKITAQAADLAAVPARLLMRAHLHTSNAAVSTLAKLNPLMVAARGGGR